METAEKYDCSTAYNANIIYTVRGELETMENLAKLTLALV